jgi:hypothetical protein
MTVTGAEVDGRYVDVARSSRFVWYTLSRLHVFVFVAPVDPQTTAEELNQFVRATIDYSIEHKRGLPRGLQTGLAAMPVIITTELPSATRDWASRPPGRAWSGRLAAFPYPVTAEVTSGRMSHRSRVVVGGAFAPRLRKLAGQHVGRVVRDGGMVK